jgi:hypothetical protein
MQPITKMTFSKETPFKLIAWPFWHKDLETRSQCLSPEPMRHGQMPVPMITILTMKTCISLILLVLSGTAYGAAHSYKYSDLVIQDYDEMSKQVQIRIRNAHKANKDGEDSTGDAEAIEDLRDALKLIFSRPNSDNMVAKLAPDLRRELSGFSAYEDTISSLSAEATGIVNDKNATVSARSTALFVIDNILGEVRPEIAGNVDLRHVVEKIRDAKLKIDDDVIRDRKLRAMFKTKNPSEYAAEILKAMPAKK